ncbi:MAG TPA: ATP synthase F1 subunit delta [Thermoanaerobaculia bacterium]|nr:ATP synthase F1 subunit delta [Thermoanaerobaculia bacterium]
MARVNDKEMAVAGVYSRAILALAEEKGLADQVLEELDGLARLVEEDADLATFLESPLVDAKARAQALERSLRGRVSDLLVDALQVVNRKERLLLLPAIAAAYRQEFRQLRGLVDVRIKTAVPLGEPLRRELEAAVNRYTGRKAFLVESVDPQLLGGMVIQIGDEKIDASVASHLKDMNDALLRRASQEIVRGTPHAS